MPASLTRGPSAHQMGPSPSHTLVGVQVKVTPVGTIAAARRKRIIGPGMARNRSRRYPDRGAARILDRLAERALLRPLLLQCSSETRRRQSQPENRIEETARAGSSRLLDGNGSRPTFGCCGTPPRSSLRDARMRSKHLWAARIVTEATVWRLRALLPLPVLFRGYPLTPVRTIKGLCRLIDPAAERLASTGSMFFMIKTGRALAPTRLMTRCDPPDSRSRRSPLVEK